MTFDNEKTMFYIIIFECIFLHPSVVQQSSLSDEIQHVDVDIFQLRIHFPSCYLYVRNIGNVCVNTQIRNRLKNNISIFCYVNVLLRENAQVYQYLEKLRKKSSKDNNAIYITSQFPDIFKNKYPCKDATRKFCSIFNSNPQD